MSVWLSIPGSNRKERQGKGVEKRDEFACIHPTALARLKVGCTDWLGKKALGYPSRHAMTVVHSTNQVERNVCVSPSRPRDRKNFNEAGRENDFFTYRFGKRD